MAAITSEDFANNGFFHGPSIDDIHPAHRVPEPIIETESDEELDDPYSLTAGLSATIPKLQQQWPMDAKYEGGGDKIAINRDDSGMIPATPEEDERRPRLFQKVPRPSSRDSMTSYASPGPRYSLFPSPPRPPPNGPLPPIPNKRPESGSVNRDHSAPPDYDKKNPRLSGFRNTVVKYEPGSGSHVFPYSPPDSLSPCLSPEPSFIQAPHPNRPLPPPPQPPLSKQRNVYSPSRGPLTAAIKSSFYSPSLVRRPASPLTPIPSIASASSIAPEEHNQRVTSHLPPLSTWSTSSIGSRRNHAHNPSSSATSSSDTASSHPTAQSGTAGRRRTLASVTGGARLRNMLKPGLPPLIAAAKADNLPTVMHLLAPGLRTNPVSQTDKDGWTALHHAACQGHLAVAETLLAHSALTEARTKFQHRTPLYYAAAYNHADVVSVLLAAGAAPNAVSKMDGATALHKAAQKGHVDGMERLIAAGADVGLKDVESMSPLMWATQGKSLQAARLLIVHGADLETRIKLGANLENASREGLTVLHKAVGAGDLPFARLFLEMGANVDSVGIHGVKAVQRASARGDAHMVQLLIDYGADVGEAVGAEGWTALHWAARYGHRGVAQMLIAKGAWAGQRTTSDGGGGGHGGAGETARELALRHGHLDVV